MRQWMVVAVACGLLGCGKREAAVEEPRFEKSVAAPSTTAAQPAPDAPDAGVAPNAGDQPPPLPPGWVRESSRDEVPLCIFTDYAARESAPFIKQVGKQKLKPDTAVMFGAFAPRCLYRECDDSPTLQAWLDQEGDNTFVVHTRFSNEHKEGTSCTEKCEVVTAGVETPPLKPGTYVVKYGSLTREFKVPSVLNKPCLSAQK